MPANRSHVDGGDSSDRSATAAPSLSPSEKGLQQQQSQPVSHFKSQEDQDLIRLALHKSPFFTCLDKEQIERFVRTAHKEKFSPGTIVILQGCVDDEDYPEENEPPSSSVASTGKNEKHEQISSSVPQPTPKRLVTDSRNSSGEDELQEEELVEPFVDEALPQQTRIGAPVSSAPVNNNPDAPPCTDTLESKNSSLEVGLKQQPLLDSDTVDCTVEDEFPQFDQNNHQAKGEAPPRALADSPRSGVLLQDQHVPPPRSGKVRSLYIIRKGKADVWYEQANSKINRYRPGDDNVIGQQTNDKYIQPHSMGPGTLFGEGGFIFGRQHSASIIASKERDQGLECWVVDLPTFRDYVLLSDNMKAIFRQFASVRSDSTHGKGGEVYMTLDDFMKSCEQEEVERSDMIADPFPTSKLAQADPWARARVASTLHLLQPSRTQSHQQISLKNFCWFYFLLARPDPEVDIAFLLMDQQQSGRVGLAEVASLVEPVFPQTDYEADFFQRYFGVHGQQSLRLSHFSQFFADLHQELGRQVFVRASASTNGYLKPPEFVSVLRTALGWRIPTGIADRIDSLYCRSPMEAGEAAARVSMLSGSLHQETTAATAERAKVYVATEMEQSERGYGDHIFSYPDFLAFQEVINNLPGICNLIDRAQEIKKGPLSPDDFKVANRVLGMGGRLSRRQVEIVFALFDLDKDGYISHQDTISVCGVDYARRLVAVEGREGRLTFAPPPEYRPPASRTAEPPKDQSTYGKIVQAFEYFGVTALASAVGTVLLFPVDVVKTRLMHQRLDLRGARMYKGFVDCLQRALTKEGFFGLYRGLTPQLIGVAPEKIIKLQVNDLLRKSLGSKDEATGKPIMNLPLETFAGAVSGACQLLVTNPMELVKIRMQMQGETIQMLGERGWAHTKPQSPVDIVKSLGFPGIYRGASSCLLRDIFFGAMYFPMYAWLKEQFASGNEISGFTTTFDLMAAGTAAGVPAAFLTTPLDVIKTKLQTLPRPGEQVYLGIQDCASMIYKQEGLAGFFLGSGARVCRIAPQFGITLLVYDSVRELTGTGIGTRGTPPSPPTNAFVEPYDYHTAFPVRSFQPKTKEISDFMNAFGQQNKK